MNELVISNLGFGRGFFMPKNCTFGQRPGHEHQSAQGVRIDFMLVPSQLRALHSNLGCAD